MTDIHDEFSEWLGVYALDAMDPDERDRIELHLIDCPLCQAEVAEHREVAAFLTQTGAPAPEGVWGRIASELSPPAPPLRMTIAPVPEPEAAPDEVSQRRQVQTRTMLAMLAVAACIVAVLGIVTVGQSNRLDRLETALDDSTLEGMANEAVANSEVQVRLTGDAGNAEAVVAANGKGFLIMDDMPVPPSGQVYQLWGKVDGTVLSLGTFGSDSTIVPFSVDPERIDAIELFAVTQEQAPGVAISEQEAVIAGTV